MTNIGEDLLDPFGLNLGVESDVTTEEVQPPTVLTFTLCGQIFAVDVQYVQEILDNTDVSALPNAPHDVLGIIDLRGKTIAIVDLASRVGAAPVKFREARIVVFEFSTGDDYTSVGVMAEKVLRVQDLRDKDVEAVPETLSGWRCDVASGIFRTEGGIAIILDITRVICGAGRFGEFDFN